MKRLAIFASGSGSNAEKICEYFAAREDVEVSLIFTNNPQAGVIKRACKMQIPVVFFDKKTLYQTRKVLQILQNEGIDLVVLAGFMLLVPPFLVEAFPNRIINIHPALLPKYGGKGMYGQFVHEAVVNAKEKESGITIHYVNEHYDEGDVIFQATCEVVPTDTSDDVATKIHALEHENYPRVIDEILYQKR
ncbi:phosphoribosylglycinamide formyltransferase [Dyadobacter psychrophilus]|uniref:Phosphoribosylglycinamide formyltransferase n=1 Tax=Dyadobacter psychrophilus TaxID=651661 RepID=A0A1T5BD29_9BACT|nr:phosphoribosylglycinamide formyltransferase [Dyadobacter psychrophilus]SKB45065.1 phosphoribosylglycinamide formyltransferase-1 [Dyadobacter psychrophilus]